MARTKQTARKRETADAIPRGDEARQKHARMQALIARHPNRNPDRERMAAAMVVEAPKTREREAPKAEAPKRRGPQPRPPNANECAERGGIYVHAHPVKAYTVKAHMVKSYCRGAGKK